MVELDKYQKQVKEGSGKSKTYITYNQDHPAFKKLRELRAENIDVEELVFQELIKKLGK